MPFFASFTSSPIDTSLFYAWKEGLIPGAPVIRSTLDHLHKLNEATLETKYPISRISLASLPKILNDYILLPTGNIIGDDSGPLIVAKPGMTLKDLQSYPIAIPAQNCSAHFFLNHFLGAPFQTRLCQYDEIVPLIQLDQVKFGLVNQAARFTLEQDGLIVLCDLGKRWIEAYDLPVPLGGVVAYRRLSKEILEQLEMALKASFQYAHENKHEVIAYTLKHTEEEDPLLVEKTIDLFLNNETKQLSEKGEKAIEKLLQLSSEKTDFSSTPWIFKNSLKKVSS